MRTDCKFLNKETKICMNKQIAEFYHRNKDNAKVDWLGVRKLHCNKGCKCYEKRI